MNTLTHGAQNIFSLNEDKQTAIETGIVPMKVKKHQEVCHVLFGQTAVSRSTLSRLLVFNFHRKIFPLASASSLDGAGKLERGTYGACLQETSANPWVRPDWLRGRRGFKQIWLLTLWKMRNLCTLSGRGLNPKQLYFFNSWLVVFPFSFFSYLTRKKHICKM